MKTKYVIYFYNANKKGFQIYNKKYLQFTCKFQFLFSNLILKNYLGTCYILDFFKSVYEDC